MLTALDPACGADSTPQAIWLYLRALLVRGGKGKIKGRGGGGRDLAHPKFFWCGALSEETLC